ncbi:ribosomal-protein-alanine N-acetyltransferase [Pedobacter africanus]|uniref:Spore coat polysaccharide biosynthesis protein SpsF n=1 Tax=Pedobacter africanus TaxID=151894 RepID=A0ACC6L459_9SPHI|nr:GNAT family N-acetyltransferase [Pedobacter africanus]MDR6786136.1 spore coat polysaccharide biosynthesis protein SpsF [Pedobacter africanus]
MRLRFRKAGREDVTLYYEWANENEVRKNSYSQEAIPYENHVRWFEAKIESPSSLLLLFFVEDSGQPVGQVRFENEANLESIIGISIDKNYRGMGLAPELLTLSTSYFHDVFPENKITAYIKKENISSIKSFRSAGFKNETECQYFGIKSIKLSKYD